MEHYRLRDVPRKKWPVYILTYYWPHITAALVGIFLFSSLIYLFFIHKRPDVSVLWFSSKYDMFSDTVIRDRMESLPWDVNGDGKVKIGLQYVESAEDISGNAELSMQLLTLLSAGEFNVFLVDDLGLDWLRSHDLLGSWKDLGVDGGSDEDFCVPCSQLDIFNLVDLPLLDQMYLAVAQPPSGGTELLNYQKQMKAVEELLEWTD